MELPGDYEVFLAGVGPHTRRNLRYYRRKAEDEGNCVIEKGFEAVTIGSVEKFITDTAWEEGWIEPIVPLRDRSAQSVGIVGAGPAGMTAAEYLRAQGYAVHVYDRLRSGTRACRCQLHRINCKHPSREACGGSVRQRRKPA